jgi:hypothetical protein
MTTLRGPGAAALKRRSGTAGDIRGALVVTNKGFRTKAWAPWHGQDGDFFEEEASSKIERLYHNAQPFGQGRHGQPIGIRWHRVR